MKTSVVGCGYDGLAHSVLWAQKNGVYAMDVEVDWVAMVNDCKSPIVDV